MDLDELQHALGGIVVEASYLERVLRAAFSALMGSKYAPVVDGHLTTHNLIETCERIADVHTDIGAEAKAQFKAALRACAAGNTQRNRVIHDAWAERPGDVIVTLRMVQTSQDVQVTARTLPELRQVANDLGSAADQLAAAITAAFGPEGMRVDEQLRRELGRDISADAGS
ncbi:MAG: hypothetical protein ACLQFR_00960 [Streptosporangiaceae bacterium]